MSFFIKPIQIYHLLVCQSLEFKNSHFKLVEADFERKLDEIACKDKDFMVRQTLASCRIGQKTQSLLAEDEHKDVIYTLLRNKVTSEKTLKRIKERGYETLR